MGDPKGQAEINRFEKKLFSQNGEDGILEYIFSRIGATSRQFVEFGVETGVQCNSRYLREHCGWQGRGGCGGW